ncbi:hypothetical protein H2O64_20900 [Kordia sp. YSTF-M3]|uniref:Uncharacterized protein n=1 Tax=Kordia aestuariivivens TaxID=2759037 RepID=A0ABR7QEZ1_9FLAO|nr:hypothetical protein [Kordia aestuariivivens]MBC8757141.1 hypothetical protein [Kordia aestuariivivens]
MNDFTKKNLTKLYNKKFIDKEVKNAHEEILEIIEKETEELKKDAEEIKKRNNKTFENLPKGLVFTIGNIEVCT